MVDPKGPPSGITLLSGLEAPDPLALNLVYSITTTISHIFCKFQLKICEKYLYLAKVMGQNYPKNTNYSIYGHWAYVFWPYLSHFWPSWNSGDYYLSIGHEKS